MNKRELTILEKVFTSEITAFVYQGKNKTVKKLEEEGYVVKIEKTLGTDRFGLIKVSGYVTTFKGNAEYCQNCQKDTK